MHEVILKTGYVEQARLNISNPFLRIRQNIGETAQKFLYGKTEKSQLLYPEPQASLDLLTKLQTGYAGKEEIARIDQAGLRDVASYLLLKALDTNPETQKDYLENYVGNILDNKNNMHLLQDYLNILPQDTKVQAGKFFQIHRQGANLWAEKFRNIAEELTWDTDMIPVYMAYAGTLGLKPGLEVFREKSLKKIMILIPNWINRNEPNCGYAIDLNKSDGNRVNFLSRDFMRPKNYIFIDDTRRNGVQQQLMWNFWSRESGEKLDEKRVKIVDFAPKNIRI